MGTLFSKIVSGEIQAHVVAENEKFLAFLDINPLAEGHTLVIPKKEVDYIFDVDPGLYEELWVFAKATANQIERAIPCKRIGVSVIGLEVPHAHIHLIPINSVADMNFAKSKLSFSQEELEKTANKIKQA